MEVILRGSPEEIAALVLAVQERQITEVTDKVVRALNEFTHQTELARTFQ